jgi:hypothetical protein
LPATARSRDGEINLLTRAPVDLALALFRTRLCRAPTYSSRVHRSSSPPSPPQPYRLWQLRQDKLTLDGRPPSLSRPCGRSSYGGQVRPHQPSSLAALRWLVRTNVVLARTI